MLTMPIYSIKYQVGVRILSQQVINLNTSKLNIQTKLNKQNTQLEMWSRTGIIEDCEETIALLALGY